jgi:hypothetical protein
MGGFFGGGRGLGGGFFGGGSKAFDELVQDLAGLYAYFPMTETSGTTVTDATGNGYDLSYENSPTLAGASFPYGDNVVRFGSGNDCVRAYGLDGGFDGVYGWLSVFVKMQSSAWTDGDDNVIVKLHNDFDNNIKLWKTTSDYAVTAYYESDAARRQQDMCRAFTNRYIHYAIEWLNGSGIVRTYCDGVLIGDFDNAAAWTGTNALNDFNSALAARSKSGLDPAHCDMGWAAFGADALPRESAWNNLFLSLYPDARGITVAGDSKCNDDDRWPGLLYVELETETGDVWRERPRRMAVAGYKAEDLHSYLDTNLPGMSGNPELVLFTVGANDLSGGTSESTFKTHLAGCVDAYRSEFSGIEVYIAYPWRTGYDSEADAMKTWINDVIGTYESGVYPGHDETGWFKSDWNGSQDYSDDGTHYTTLAGWQEVVSQWMTALGY